MDTAKEVVTLIKFSPKRGGLLGDIKENLDEQPATAGVISPVPELSFLPAPYRG